ncbi:MAG: SixA phosphatase family protein [Brevundimonas sp.]|uniref:SixA phosphatase family protein n=1 Tax=Brevundimonas sp. TaxID=1871086 RepID=UPI00391A651B
MDRLIIMRHAKAERASASGRDFDRALSPRGLAQALAMGEALAERRLRPDRVLVSSAARTRGTWQAMTPLFPDAVASEDEALYNAPASRWRARIEAAMAQPGTLLVIGHNPGIHELALELLEEGAGPASAGARLSEGFPTAALCVFGVDAAERFTFEGHFTPRSLGIEP